MRNPLTPEAFAEWCEKQPANATYEYANYDCCACGQYARTLGIEDWLGTESHFWLDANYAAYHSPHTFGALAARLREQGAYSL